MIWREIRLTVRSARRRDYVQRVTTRRCDIVDADSPGTYHCISRCVRRTSLLDDPKRRAWIVSRLAFLSEFMAIDVVSFAIMRNHIHLLLTTRPEIVARWTDREVAMRRTALLPNQRGNPGTTETLASLSHFSHSCSEFIFVSRILANAT